MSVATCYIVIVTNNIVKVSVRGPSFWYLLAMQAHIKRVSYNKLIFY